MPNLDPLHVYPVLPPQVASGEILSVGVEEALLEVRVVMVKRVLPSAEEVGLEAVLELNDALNKLELD